MSFDLNELGNKIRRYREQFQTTSQEMAIFTGIPEDTLKAFEHGEKQPTGDDILILADFFKCDYKFFISNDPVAPFEQTETLFRLHGDEISKEDRWAIQEVMYLAECEATLEELLDEKKPDPFKYKRRGTYFKGHAEDAAKALRRAFGYKEHEVRRDIYQDFRSVGVRVFRRKLENSNISGIYIKHPYAGKCILINYDEDIYRQRFTAAHEFAHSVLDDEKDVVISFKNFKQKDLVEIRANNFASHYLMPGSFLKKIPVTTWNEKSTIHWANKLRVSTATFANALLSHQIINKGQKKIISSFKVPRQDKIDPELTNLSPHSRARKEVLFKQGLSTQYVLKCFQAVSRTLITKAKIAEILLISESRLVDIFEIYGESFSS